MAVSTQHCSSYDQLQQLLLVISSYFVLVSQSLGAVQQPTYTRLFSVFLLSHFLMRPPPIFGFPSFDITARSFCLVFFLSIYLFSLALFAVLSTSIYFHFHTSLLGQHVVLCFFILFYVMLPVDIRYSKLSNGPFAHSLLLLILSMTGGHSVQQTVHLPFCSFIAFAHIVSYMNLSIAGMLDLPFTFIF